jgi:hypothetical protein
MKDIDLNHEPNASHAEDHNDDLQEEVIREKIKKKKTNDSKQ